MKINWGTSIVIAFILLIAFIMYFVISMMTNQKLDHDLVAEQYYEQELLHQEEIDKENNANKLIENVTWKKTNDGILIAFPKNLDYNNITGKVFLYRPSNKKLDSEIPISLSSNKMLIPKTSLLGGRWNIKIDWEYQGEKYLLKESIVY
ncbi:MAG: FixH family protein [Bacteroidia bacterium]|nr:FixH family protein [Bacteroidia bacterium]